MKRMFVIIASYYDYDDSDYRAIMVVDSEEKAKYWAEKAQRVYNSSRMMSARVAHRREVEAKRTN